MTTAVKTAVLLVDDDANFRETLADAMSLKDVAVEGAVSAGDALRVMAERLPALVLLDVQLPDGNGIELCRKMKRDPRLKGKPINLDALWEEIRYLIERQH
ncbi:MAG: response regulator [Elusimicrobia bacterium]|nr:response regulator [Elusimicrobiota bacterium]